MFMCKNKWEDIDILYDEIIQQYQNYYYDALNDSKKEKTFAKRRGLFVGRNFIKVLVISTAISLIFMILASFINFWFVIGGVIFAVFGLVTFIINLCLTYGNKENNKERNNRRFVSWLIALMEVLEGKELKKDTETIPVRKYTVETYIPCLLLQHRTKRWQKLIVWILTFLLTVFTFFAFSKVGPSTIRAIIVACVGNIIANYISGKSIEIASEDIFYQSLKNDFILNDKFLIIMDIKKKIEERKSNQSEVKTGKETKSKFVDDIVNMIK